MSEGLTQSVALGEKVAVTALAAFQKQDGRAVVVAEVEGGEHLVILAEANAGVGDFTNAAGPYALADLIRHADACVVGDRRALTDGKGQRALAMMVVACMHRIAELQKETSG